MTLTAAQTLNLGALGLLIVAWVLVRRRLQLSPFHLWLGSALAAVVAVLAAALRAHSYAGPIADLAMVAASLLAGYCFSLGVRAEAKYTSQYIGPILAGLAATLALALILELAIGDPVLRSFLLRVCIALEYLSVFLWVPDLLRSTVPRVGTALLAFLAGFIALAMFVQPLISAGIILAAVIFAIFSVERARTAG